MSKGKRTERETAEVYEQAGYHTYRPQESKYDETDIFGLFDILAVPPAGANAKVRLVQVKTNAARGIEAWSHDAMDYASASVHVEFVVRYDGQGGHHPTPRRFRCIEPIQDGMTRRVTTLDEREDDTPADGEGLLAHLAGQLGVGSA